MSVTATAGTWQDGIAVAVETDEPLWQPPDEPADDKPRPPGARQQRQPPPTPPGAGPWGAGRPGGPRYPLRAGLMERLLPLVAERHPELAEKLRRLRQRSPEEFRRVLADALAMRLEEALERGERRPFGPGRPPRGAPEWDEPEREVREQHVALAREAHELHRHNEELEQRSYELAERFRELRERRDSGLEPELDEVRRQIERTVEEHFNVRTELRRIELRRVEMELDRLRETVERIRDELERRERARGAITERRLRQLLGEGGEDW